MPPKPPPMRLTIRLDPAMRKAFTELQEQAAEEGAPVNDSTLARTLIRSALGSDMNRSAVAESIMMLRHVNRLAIARLMQLMRDDMDAIVAEAVEGTDDV